jgi:hypothetical protein
MGTIELKRALDDASAALAEMHHAAVAELQKANEAEAKDYVKYLESQIKSIAQVAKYIEAAMQGKESPFV